MKATTFWSSSVRPGVRWFAVFSSVLLLPLTAFQIWDYLEVRALGREVRLVAAAGESLDERASPGTFPFIEPSLESAGQYYLAAGVLALGSEAGTAVAPIRDWASEPSGPSERVEAVVAPAHALVRRNQEALTLVDRATRLSYRGMPAGSEFSYRVAGLGAVSSLLTARVASESARGQAKQAVEAVVALVRLRGVLRDLSTLPRPETFVGVLLTLAPAGDEELAALQLALEADERTTAAREAFFRARARMFAMTTGLHRIDATSGDSRQVGLAAAAVRPFVARRVRRALVRWRELLPLLERPWSEQLPILRQIVQDGDDERAPYRQWANDAFRRVTLDVTLAQDRCAVAAIAVRRFTLAHEGQLPKSLDDIVPDFLRAVPLDPYGTGALRYRRDEGGFTVYSLGPDALDDGGDLTSFQRAASLRPVGARGADVGIRVALGLTRTPTASERGGPVPSASRR